MFDRHFFLYAHMQRENIGQLGTRLFRATGHSDHAVTRGVWRFASPRNRRFAPLGFYWIPTYCLISVYHPVRAEDQFNHWLNSTWHQFFDPPPLLYWRVSRTWSQPPRSDFSTDNDGAGIQRLHGVRILDQHDARPIHLRVLPWVWSAQLGQLQRVLPGGEGRGRRVSSTPRQAMRGSPTWLYILQVWKPRRKIKTEEKAKVVASVCLGGKKTLFNSLPR